MGEPHHEREEAEEARSFVLIYPYTSDKRTICELDSCND